jgi:two-component sensor histidine kinase
LRHAGSRDHRLQWSIERKDGGLIAVSLTVSPVKDAGGKIVGASKIARDITEQKRNQEQINVLAREAEHRSKNILSNVQAIVNLSQSDTSEGLKDAISGRIQAMSNVHSLFVKARWIGAEVSAIAKQELAPYLDEHEARVRMEGLETVLEPTAAQAVAVVLHELATNASKYGALSDAKGQIRLTWSRSEDGQLVLRWTELGGPRVNAPERKGFGSRLIEGTISQLGGKARFDWRSEGLVCDIAVRTWNRNQTLLRCSHRGNFCSCAGFWTPATTRRSAGSHV